MTLLSTLLHFYTGNRKQNGKHLTLSTTSLKLLEQKVIRMKCQHKNMQIWVACFKNQATE